MALKKSQQSLKNWTKQKWRTKSGKKSAETGERYLPEAAIKNMSDEEYAATTRAKREGTRKGKQFVAQPKKIAKKTKQYRTMKNYKKGGKISNYNVLSAKAGPERQAALAQYLSFSGNDINSIGVKNIDLGQFFQEGGMTKRKKSEEGMVPEAAPTKGVKRAKPLSDKEYFAREAERRRKGRASMTNQQKVNMLTGLMMDDEPKQGKQRVKVSKNGGPSRELKTQKLTDKQFGSNKNLDSILEKKFGRDSNGRLRANDVKRKSMMELFKAKDKYKKTSAASNAAEVMARTSPNLLRKSEAIQEMKPSKQTRDFFSGGAVLSGALKGALKGGASAAIGQIGAGVGEEVKVPTAKSGMRFKKLSNKIQKSGKSKAAANAIAASIGRKKYGAKKFAAMGRAGRK